MKEWNGVTNCSWVARRPGRSGPITWLALVHWYGIEWSPIVHKEYDLPRSLVASALISELSTTQNWNNANVHWWAALPWLSPSQRFAGLWSENLDATYTQGWDGGTRAYILLSYAMCICPKVVTKKKETSYRKNKNNSNRSSPRSASLEDGWTGAGVNNTKQ